MGGSRLSRGKQLQSWLRSAALTCDSPCCSPSPRAPKKFGGGNFGGADDDDDEDEDSDDDGAWRFPSNPRQPLSCQLLGSSGACPFSVSAADLPELADQTAK